ncbi:MAG TPA: 30S ribosomal protein S17 [Candidatus Nanoarchaeia archaeon]|nr:30S ribosomal protein S17 [Candidatus Nanoarchaeia archaeon]
MKTQQKQATPKREKNAVVATHGRVFQGYVTKKFAMRVVVEFDRTIYLPKYERFMKDKTRLHARLPAEMDVEVGDYVKVRECRPLSKIIHFVVIEIVRKAHTEEVKAK